MWLKINWNLLLLSQQFLVDIESFVIVSFCSKSLNLQKWFFQLLRKLLLLEPHCHPEPKHEDLSHHQCHWRHFVNPFLLQGFCIQWITPVVFDYFLLDQSINQNNWSLNFVEWEFYVWFLKHQPSWRKYQYSIQVGNLSFLILMLIPKIGFCFEERVFSWEITL